MQKTKLITVFHQRIHLFARGDTDSQFIQRFSAEISLRISQSMLTLQTILISGKFHEIAETYQTISLFGHEFWPCTENTENTSGASLLSTPIVPLHKS